MSLSQSVLCFKESAVSLNLWKKNFCNHTTHHTSEHVYSRLYKLSHQPPQYEAEVAENVQKDYYTSCKGVFKRDDESIRTNARETKKTRTKYNSSQSVAEFLLSSYPDGCSRKAADVCVCVCCRRTASERMLKWRS